MQITSFGPGDDATWGACLGHPNDPRSGGFFCDEGLSEEEAQEMAADELSATPGSVVAWLSMHCDDDAAWQPVDTSRIGEDLSGLTISALVALIVVGTHGQLKAARHELRARYEQAHEEEISDAAQELMLEA